jgi:hypothetical protein
MLQKACGKLANNIVSNLDFQLYKAFPIDIAKLFPLMSGLIAALRCGMGNVGHRTGQ